MIAVPLIVIVIIRVYRALAATFNLLSDWTLLRALPWRYITKLPLRHGWIAIAGWSLLVTVVCTVLVVIRPGKDASNLAGGLGCTAATLGLASSWIRAALTWRRLRGH